MLNTNSNDTREKIILKKENDNKTEAENFFNDNIDRLVNQCKTGGNNAFSYVAIFSFLEGYFRKRFPKEFGFSKNNENYITFPGIADAFIYYCKVMISDSNEKKNAILNLTDLRIMYNNYEQDEWDSSENTDTNHIRHCFADLKPGTLFIVLNKVIDFFKTQNINTYKLVDLANSENIKSEKNATKHLQFFSGTLENFYSDFDDFNKYLKHKKLLNSSLKDFLIENYPEKNSGFFSNILPEKNPLLGVLKDCFDSINNKDIDYFKEKENFLTALSTSLDQEISGRDYDKEKIKLNDEQKKFVDECYDILISKEKDFVITGAPGTGKTLVLISALLVLHKKHNLNPPLLTFSDSLEKYNEYLCKNYNKSFSKQLGISEYSEDDLKIFISEHLKSFENWLDKKLERIIKHPVFKIDTNKGKENFTNINNEFNRFPEELFELAISDIWPNCKEPTDELKELHKVIEDTLEEKPDLYVYWKFATQIDESFINIFGGESREETLFIDEVQDLTKAQLETARKISKKGCFLAGDIFQSIRHQCKNWEDIGINGNDVKELTENYRMSENIQRLGNSYLKKCNRKSYSDSKGKAVPGPKPQLFISSDEQKNEIYTQILSSIKLLLDKCDKSPKDIFIVTPSDSEVKKIKQLISKDSSLNNIQIRELKVDKNEEIKFDENKITIGTIDSIKGIDCPIVLLLLNESILERPTETLSNSIYTVINRAMHLLQIFMPESLSESAEPSIENLVTLLRSVDYKEDKIPTWVYKFNPSEIKTTTNGEKYLFGKYKCKDEDVEGVIHGKILNKNNPAAIEKFLNYEFHVKIYRKDQNEYDELTPVLRNKK